MWGFRRRLCSLLVVLWLLGSLLVAVQPVVADDFYYSDSITYPNPRQYTSEVVRVNLSWTDDGSVPLTGTPVCVTAHYKTTDSTYCGTTDGAGNVTISWYISGASRGYTVAVDLTADTGNGPTIFDTLYFTPA